MPAEASRGTNWKDIPKTQRFLLENVIFFTRLLPSLYYKELALNE